MNEAAERRFDRKTFLKKAPLMFLRAFFEGTRGEKKAPPPPAAARLRPPGAAPEAEFLELCCGIGACAEVCPADAIQLVPRPDDSARRAPVIVPSVAACVVCEDLACMRACPSGALTPVAREDIRMGLARVDPDACWAWTSVDPGCDYCADRCPLGASAISMRRTAEGRGPEVREGCVGCGVCEYYCPTSPAAIQVTELQPS